MGFIDHQVIAVGCTNHCKDVLATADGFFFAKHHQSIKVMTFYVHPQLSIVYITYISYHLVI